MVDFKKMNASQRLQLCQGQLGEFTNKGNTAALGACVGNLIREMARLYSILARQEERRAFVTFRNELDDSDWSEWGL